jgi:serine protease inhibitor
MPKFTFETQYGLSDTLKQWVMDAFDPSWQISRAWMAATLSITDAVHKAFIAVEKAQAAAAR